MSHARAVDVPTLHLFAELAAYPFASEAAFRLGLTVLSPAMNEETGRFWRLVETEVLRSFPFSIDELVNLRDLAWFREAGDTVPLAGFLRDLPARCLSVEGSTVRPKLPDELKTPASSGADARRFWQWMGMALPPDLLLAAAREAPPCHKVAFVSPRLEQMLKDKGFAQLHLHFGAASEFSDLWVGALLVLADSRGREELFGSPGAAFGEGRELDDWLARAALIRYLLAVFLAERAPKPDGGFMGWIKHAVYPLLSATSAALLQVVLREVATGQLLPEHGVTYTQVRSLYARLGGIHPRRMPERAVDIQKLDPIARLFPAASSSSDVTPEMQFVTAGLAHLERGGPVRETGAFARLFWQVVRLRCLFYRHLVQRPLTPGLQWFFRFYDRIRSARAWGTVVQIESAAHLEGIDHGLASLELRTAPDNSISRQLQLFRDVAKAARKIEKKTGGGDLEVGLVLHFTRDRGGGAREGLSKNRWKDTYGDPGFQSTGWRYSVYYQQKRKEAMALAWAIQHFPFSLYLLRGIDVCTDEVGVPTWVLVPLFQYIHRASEEATVFLQQAHGLVLPRLRSTIHTGEDFPHLLYGLRRITETMEHFPLREGDRIGHAIALGLDPHDWARRTGSVVMAREDRLFDLVWEWGWYARARVSPPDSRRAPFLEREICRLSREIFDEPHPADMLELAVEKLHKPDVLCRLGFPTSQPFHGRTPHASKREEILLARFLTDPVTFRRGRELEWVRTGPDADALATIQSELLVHVGAHGIVVEANPSSNLLVGDLRDLGRHPLWRLSPPRDSAPTPPISVCLGSDDPVTFATTLREDYQRLVDALVLSGLSQEQAERWLERVRQQGLDSRFTLPAGSGELFLKESPRRKVSSVDPPP